MFARFSFRFQLALAFTAVVVLFLATLSANAWMLNQVRAEVLLVNDRSLPMLLAVEKMNLARSQVQQFLTDVAATHDPAAYAEADAAAQDFRTAAKALRAQLGAMGDAVRHKQLDAIERDFDGFMKVGRQMTEAYLQQGLEAGNALMKGDGGLPGFDQASEKIGEHLQALREDQVARSRQEAMALANSTRVMQWSMLGGAVLAALLGLALATATVRSVHSALGGDPRAAAAIVERVGAGELDVAIDRDKAHPGSLLARLDEMQRRLAALVAQVRQQSHDIEETSVAIARDGGDLSQRTASQVAALQQTASTMAQVDTGIRQGVQGVRQADTLAAEACDRATQGGETVSRFVETMAGIDEASRRIADIIGVIDGIAFQTNILALNAAVEAARAGEQGRGFAVVASEVRALAGRSAAAAREVKALIQTTAQRVEQGTLLVTEARDTMASVVRSIGEVSRAMAGVVESAGAQSIGVSEVAAAVTSMDGMTQANSALVERSATAAERLRQQSHALAEAMQAFRLGDGPPLAGAAAIG